MSTRDEYVKKLHAKLDEWNADLDKLEARAQGMKANTKLALHSRIDELRAQRDAVREKLGELQHSSEDAWGDLKAGVELAWESMSEALRSAYSHFNK